MPTEQKRTATIYRMVMPDHLCPYGLKSKALLERKGYAVEDHWLRTREETDAFKARHGVDTTPQTWIEGVRVGGYDQLRAYFGEHVPAPDETSYRPVIALFVVALLIALAIAHASLGTLVTWRTLQWFVAVAMTLLGAQKLRDIEDFTTMFLGYDLLARRWVGYAYAYPYAEMLAGVLMIAGVWTWLAAPVTLVIGTVGAASVIKAVYIDRRSLKCACVGGDSKVPLGFVSLTENLMMVAMGVWMPLRLLLG